MAKKPTSESILSASATATETAWSGRRRSGPAARSDRRWHRPRRPAASRAARSSAPSCPAARELADQARDEVGLGKARGLLGLRCIGALDLPGDPAGELDDTLGLVVHRAELGVEHDGLQNRQARFQRCLQVLGPEDSASLRRARSTRSLPLTIALPPSLAAMFDTTAKCVTFPPRQEREVFLVLAHRGA